MSRHRFFLAAPLIDETAALPLSERDRHHLCDVLRLRTGDEVVLVEPGGRQRVARLEATGPQVRASVVGELPASRTPRVTLFQGLAKGERMDLVVQKATELGAEEIVPVAFERSVVRLDAAKGEAKADRWRRVALEAAKQSQRAVVPRVSAPVAATAVPELLAGYEAALLLWEEATDAPSVGQALRATSVTADALVAVIVGPEGGLTSEEVRALSSAGATPVTLGPGILRTETAAIVALALVEYEMGGLGNEPGSE